MATKSRAANAAHTAGIFADMTLDGPEIGTLVAVVDRAKNLPNRKTMGKQDPYCAMRLGKEAKKTDTDKRGGQTPRWDQELRFNVHDSPDYYKLKCSIFNDDKKTDLIGEAWINLERVIVPGGGKNDLWHQLNFKGKYAGDIRVELTYYDTRPKPEVSPERKKQREKSHSLASDIPSNSSGSRQLGPREIKRRPLPPGPGGYSSPVERLPADEPLDPWNGQNYTNSNPPPRPPKQLMPETPDDVGFGLPSQYSPDPYALPQPDPYDIPPPPLHHPQEQRRPSNDPYNDNQRQSPLRESPGYDDRRTATLPPTTQLQPYVTDEFPQVEAGQLPSPQSPYSPSAQSPYYSPPSSRTTPQATPTRPVQSQGWQGRGSTSPTKHAVYRDSPLRQSISQHDMPRSENRHFDPQFDEEDAPPPPPPAHRGHISKSSVTTAYPAPTGQALPRTPNRYDSVEERSPLQRLEQQYDPYSSPSAADPSRQPPADLVYGRAIEDDHDQPRAPIQQRTPERYDAYVPSPNARGSPYNESTGHRRPISSGNKLPAFEEYQGRSPVDQRYGGLPQDSFRRSTGYDHPRRAQTFDDYGHFDDRHRMSEPPVSRPRAVSPNPPRNIPRKSITPTPSTPEDRRKMSGIPYGPDAYDVLNPGTSPTVGDDSYSSSHEAARQREVEKMRDQGPIIGNDGRVIDPSDHLPADTWAPEPERKNRKPEHVIRIRTREEARIQQNTGSSPASMRPHSIATSPHQPSPGAPASSPYQPSPTSTSMEPAPRGEPGSARNRLKKSMPTRPLPAQPYPHAQTSPAVMTTSPDARPSPPSQRHSAHSSPIRPPQRPPLSEYQAPAMYDHGSRGGPNSHDYPPTPTKPPHHRPSNSMDYGGYGDDNSLALELSTIDIGPSRTGRTSLRPVRGYGAY
ncbi:uncharacterized protein PV06_04581 [Exophiala oligosperma]|uniref:C2 domain-containing protein n=1 Tax=Exophiala oligosperma TaxID=215243 RepID=A0A0D2C1B3_9EURO|nr:uncharacterized protein PV06_04581 [Exophiala oligosperma]KIW43482.1 hypothetical protein PV06_04581 [Exophiala oligosperma]